MALKKFSGKSLSEALSLAEQALGKDAVIVDMQEHADGAHVLVQVTEEVIARIKNVHTETDRSAQELHQLERLIDTLQIQGRNSSGESAVSNRVPSLSSIPNLVAVPEPFNPQPDPQSSSAAGAKPKNSGEIRTIFDYEGQIKKWEITKKVQTSSASTANPENVAASMTAPLTSSPEASAPAKPAPANLTETKIIKFIEQNCAIDNLRLPLPQPLMLVGANGSGKTATLVKIAALCKKMRVPVTMISADIYKTGAQNQLADYAKALEVSWQVVAEHDKLAAIIRKHSASVLLIDTPGVNWRKHDEMTWLQQLITETQITPVLIHAAGYTYHDNRAVAQAFTEQGCRQFIFTKVDHWQNKIGAIVLSNYSRSVEHKLAIAGYTDSPLVLESIKPASAEIMYGWWKESRINNNGRN